GRIQLVEDARKLRGLGAPPHFARFLLHERDLVEDALVIRALRHVRELGIGPGLLLHAVHDSGFPSRGSTRKEKEPPTLGGPAGPRSLAELSVGELDPPGEVRVVLVLRSSGRRIAASPEIGDRLGALIIGFEAPEGLVFVRSQEFTDWTIAPGGLGLLPRGAGCQDRHAQGGENQKNGEGGPAGRRALDEHFQGKSPAAVPLPQNARMLAQLTLDSGWGGSRI